MFDPARGVGDRLGVRQVVPAICVQHQFLAGPDWNDGYLGSTLQADRIPGAVDKPTGARKFLARCVRLAKYASGQKRVRVPFDLDVTNAEMARLAARGA